VLTQQSVLLCRARDGTLYILCQLLLPLLLLSLPGLLYTGEGVNIAGTPAATAGGLQQRLSAQLRAGWRAA
jgi:hypothetical protein